MTSTTPHPEAVPAAALPSTDSPIARTLGLRLHWVDPDAGTAEVGFTVGEEFTNIHGTVQGGILIAMLDATMGPTLRATLPAGTEAPTLDIATHFLAPAGIGDFTGRGRLRRKGRGIAFIDADLLDADGVEVATATATFRIRSSPGGKTPSPV